MVKTLKKASAALLAVSLVTAVMAGLAINVSASIPLRYEFGTWMGEGSVSVGIDHNEFVKLTYGGEDVGGSNYSVTRIDDGTVITLKEEYLKTLLNGGNGEYHFWAVFSEKLERFNFRSELDLNGANGISISGLDHTKFEKLTYGDEEINPLSYTVTASKDDIIITFKEEYEEYLETLNNGEDSFWIYFMVEDIVDLRLNVDIQVAPSIEPSATPSAEPSNIPTADSPTPSPVSPKTGDHASMKGWLITLSLSVAGCAVALKTCRNRKNVT